MGRRQGQGPRFGVRLKLVYGGTFDPPHNGHLAVAAAAAAAFQVPVDFLPSADPPHRAPTAATAEQRADMVEAAIAGDARFACDRRELHRGGPSYSLLTLRELRAELGPTQPIAWLIGIDAFLGLDRWHAWRELFEFTHFIVVERPGRLFEEMGEELAAVCRPRWRAAPAALAQAAHGLLYRLPMPLRPESATGIRAGLQAGHDMNAQLPAPVAAYIRRHGLYPSGV